MAARSDRQCELHIGRARGHVSDALASLVILQREVSSELIPLLEGSDCDLNAAMQSVQSLQAGPIVCLQDKCKFAICSSDVKPDGNCSGRRETLSVLYF